jgi:monofunctional biosynthetic peptidoglycan transglycosylase
MGRKTSINKWWSYIWKTLVLLWFIKLILIILLRWIPIYITPLVIIRGVEKLVSGKQIGYSKTWKSWDEISHHLKLGAIASEDQNFLNHNGFDFGAIEKAIDYNKKQEKKGTGRRRGASTISQQTAKNVFLWPGRSFIRKGFEVYFTFWIELIWGKKRILEVYLNIVELGDGVYGAEAAAQKYFKREAKKLTTEQSALLIAALPAPRKYSVTKPGPYMVKRQQWVLQQMRFNSTAAKWIKEQ